jgi:transposase|nr:MAG TPA: Protein of unknown function (DUF1804) [Caudoviricetes sp.]
MVAHFYATVSYLFCSQPGTMQFCCKIQHVFNILQDMKKADIEKKKSLGRALYLSGMEQTEIADKIGVSRVTVSKWCSAEGWKEARAAKSITRPELVNKLLLTIDTLIEQVNESKDASLIAGLGDKLAKLSSVIEKLDKKANVVDAIEVFMAFSKWLEHRAQTDPELTPDLIKAINKYQDKYIVESMGASLGR